MAAKRTVIVGGVAGGASCAARLRRLDGERDILLLERGPYISYANCGLPYHLGGTIRRREALLLFTPEQMRDRFRIDVRVHHEAVGIDRAAKTVRVRNLETGEERDEPYDELVLATGSDPVRPPIPGIESPRVRTLWTVPDTDGLKELAAEAKSAVVVGGGFIGIEVAENLRERGLAVALVEAAGQVMTPLDPEMAMLLHGEVRAQGVDLRLGAAVESFKQAGPEGPVEVRLAGGATVSGDFVVLAIGVRPNSKLAREAGLETNARGGVVVDSSMRTSDPSVWAVGDVAEVEDFVSKERTMVPLAGPANKQGRIAADSIAGRDSAYRGTQGSSVAKVFRLTAAATGANEKALVRRGWSAGREYETLIITQNSHAGYYPGAVPMTLKLIFSKPDGAILGAQIVGRDGVDKRIDTIGTAMRLGARAVDLKDLEFAYAPPYSSAKDPVNMAGFVAENIQTGLVRFATWDEPEKNPATVRLDVREEAEIAAFAVPEAVHIPLGQLRGRVGELDRSASYIVFCAAGVRAYTAARILAQAGFGNVKVYPGGVRFYQATHPEAEASAPSHEKFQHDAPQYIADKPSIRKLDCTGMQCPGPIMEVFKAMKELKEGDRLEVRASDPGFARDVESWCRRTGNTVVSNGSEGSDVVAVLQRGTGGAAAAQPATATPGKSGGKGKTIVVFDGDMDKILASLVIANGALAMGRPVTMFFTFWGLAALRRSKPPRTAKSFIERMFGAMLPRGAERTKLSKLNMGGAGTAMMRGVMRKKKIDSVETMLQKAIAGGAKIIACSMSMDVMGLRPEELIDGVEIGGVGTYLGDAEEADLNLFV